MSFRDHVIQINQEVSYHVEMVFDVIGDGIEWIAPFTPWIAFLTFIASFAVLWHGL